ncbi:YqaA family protein [Coprobacter tertius]|uniref:DedA family protein n=1 Tax=Coprobacter tertius TaxID=2944915 RepID=A0ABT1MD49_9BACT|nr:DedA family protein [Coprobacter tertius]MCP9610562.1 DedA family protein [Coprobacter tertius]
MEFISALSEWGYIGLFLAAFLAGSILPFSSEVVLGLLLAAGYPPWACLITATAGNWLGGVTCYYVGRLGRIDWIEKYFKVKRSSLDKAQKFLQGKGALMAFFVFLPFGGDLIILSLGLMRANVLIVNLSMLAGKFLRYYVVMVGVGYFSSLF